jgi:hypothetical protein
MLVLQCGPERGWPARGGQIPASRRRAWPGNGVRRLRGSLGFGLWPQKGGGALVAAFGLAAVRPGRGRAGAGKLGETVEDC